MQLPGSYDDLATLRCAERQQRALHNWQIEQALAGTRPPAPTLRRHTTFLRRIALRAAWHLTRLAGADNGPYTVQERATLVDARGNARTICPEETYFVLLPHADRSDRDAA